MLKHLLLAGAVALSVAAAPAPTTGSTADDTAEVDYEVSLESGGSETVSSSPAPGGVNALYFEQAPGVGGAESCSKSPDTYCEHILVELTKPVPADDEDGKVKGLVSAVLETEAADYDVFLYESDATGTIGAELDRSTAFPLGDTSESVSGQVTTTVDDPTTHVLVRVVFFAPVTPHSTTISFF